MISKAQERRQAKQLEQLSRIRGEERKQHFANGGTLHDWRGGLHLVTEDKKKRNNKKACRGKIRL